MEVVGNAYDLNREREETFRVLLAHYTGAYSSWSYFWLHLMVQEVAGTATGCGHRIFYIACDLNRPGPRVGGERVHQPHVMMLARHSALDANLVFRLQGEYASWIVSRESKALVTNVLHCIAVGQIDDCIGSG